MQLALYILPIKQLFSVLWVVCLTGRCSWWWSNVTQSNAVILVLHPARVHQHVSRLLHNNVIVQ